MREPVDDPLAFAPDDEGAWHRLARGYRLAGLLLSAHRLGLLQRLCLHDRTTDELAWDLDADPTVVNQMCRALAAAGLLEWPDPAWSVSAAGRRLLDDPAAAAELDSLVLDYRRWGALDERARRPPIDEGVPSEPADPESARRYALRLAARHRGQAVALVGNLEPTRRLRVMDVGGADGFLAREVCARWPEVECVVLEQPAMAEVARSTCKDIARITVIDGDFLGESAAAPTDPLPGNADVVVLSHVLQGRPTDVQRTDSRGPLDTILWAVGQSALRRAGHMLTTVDQDMLVRATGLAASASFWVSDSARAVIGVNTAVGVKPALDVLYEAA